ncbi:bZIP transcription factor hapX [Psilocybe cubensis]|uniref:BZIP domain-containing protein n=2 Tax=Psilocybe cubensis TaxID=181762 RepID=A0A8H8CQN9_PSICU|nr:bZIP transcription factor hapX [Psilocybe cubensis]KAH9486819.1 bZIP transcription factor hapX [Psilocybe cubensis]
MASASASSSTTTLWATASKEWVIQPKPKPGRKPKKDSTSPTKAEQEQIDTKGRRIQNRAAQRAFRERKQSQLSELQARIQSYEQGEVERNVALQNIAKRLKEENEKLRNENLALQAKLSQMQQQQQQQEHLVLQQTSDQKPSDDKDKKKRRRDDSPAISLTLNTDNRSSKKTRKINNCDILTSTAPAPAPSLSFSPSVASTPDSNDTTDSQFPPLSYGTSTEMDVNSFNHFNDLAPNVKADEMSLRPFVSFGCGFCNEDTICVCQEMAVVDRNSNDFTNTQVLINRENLDTNFQESVVQEVPSILDNLPPYQPPVALRRRSGAVQVNSVFPVQVVSTSSRPLDENCSGDPSNCLACGDDAFGKAFCAAIGNTASALTDCNGCPPTPGRPRACCGGKSNGLGCGNCPSSPLDDPTINGADLIPTNDAWKKIKAHPNVEFADLSLLAEVVSSRSKCLGPRIVISPAPQLSQNAVEINNFSTAGNGGEIRPGRTSPPLRLVPQEVLLECGRRRLRQVHAEGVRDALRLLDAKFS